MTDAAVVVLDIGGGSTEIVTKVEGEILSVSLDIGCVRLTERFLHGDPPTAAEVADCGAGHRRGVGPGRPRRSDRWRRTGRARRLVGLAGTVSTLASLELGLAEYDRERIHHAVLTAASVGRWCDVLGAEPVAERARRRGLPAGRRDVIFGGALVLREVMHRFAFPECIVSEADILDGLVMSLRLQAGPTGGRRAADERPEARARPESLQRLVDAVPERLCRVHLAALQQMMAQRS